MKTIKLTQCKVALVDDEDYERLSVYKWHYNSGYVKNVKKGFLHSLLLVAPRGLYIDHINGNPLDNRKCNLRVVTHAQNMYNKGVYKNSKSGTKGVSWSKDHNKWVAKIEINKKSKFLGYFSDLHVAKEAYQRASIDNWGEYAR